MWLAVYLQLIMFNHPFCSLITVRIQQPDDVNATITNNPLIPGGTCWQSFPSYQQLNTVRIPPSSLVIACQHKVGTIKILNLRYLLQKQVKDLNTLNSTYALSSALCVIMLLLNVICHKYTLVFAVALYDAVNYHKAQNFAGKKTEEFGDKVLSQLIRWAKNPVH